MRLKSVVGAYLSPGAARHFFPFLALLSSDDHLV
jgi:hypothetical protein